MVKKSISKKITALAVGLALSAMSCMTALAGYIHEVGWSDEPCPRCKEDVAIWIREERFDSSPTGYQLTCSHHRFGTDLEMENVTVITYECHECNYVDVETERSYFWKCCGFDMPDNN